MSHCRLLLSGFADETSSSKLVAEQFAVMSALGLKYLSLRFVDAGNGIKNVMQLDDAEIELILHELERFGLQVSSLGSPIGKVKLFDFEDDSNNAYFEFGEYLTTQVATACRLAHTLQTKLIRGFSFYHPRGETPDPYIDQVARQLREICELCDSNGLTYGLEVEANLVGQNAKTLMQIYEAVDHPALLLIFDGANLITQGFSTAEVVEQFRLMLPALGWIHIKDYQAESTERKNYVDEEALNQFVPAGLGDSGYDQVLNILKQNFSDVAARMNERGVAGIFADLEPHLRQGGQFGGYSGPDGFGVATRAFASLCEQTGVECKLTTQQTMNDRQRNHS